MDLIIYYTRTNNTKKVSEIIASEKGAKLLEVKDKKNRKGLLQFLIGGFDAIRGKKTKISYDTVDLSEYDTVYVGTPVWAAKPTPAILQFIEENDFNGINVITFATMGGSGGDSTIKVMNNAIKAKGGKILRSFALAINGKDIKELTLDAINDQ